MESCFSVIRQSPLSQNEIEDLRVAVGWDRFEGVYDRILQRSYAHFSISDGTRLIGFVHVISDGIGDAFLVDLMVHPDFQGRGLGQMLIKHAVADLSADGIRCIQVVFEPGLEKFYRQCGFGIAMAGVIDRWRC